MLAFWMVILVFGAVTVSFVRRARTWKLLVPGNVALLFCDAVEDVGLEGTSERPRILCN